MFLSVKNKQTNKKKQLYLEEMYRMERSDRHTLQHDHCLKKVIDICVSLFWMDDNNATAHTSWWVKINKTTSITINYILILTKTKCINFYYILFKL